MAVAECVVVVHYAIGDAMMWIILLRYSIVRYFCFVCAFSRKCSYGAMYDCIVV